MANTVTDSSVSVSDPVQPSPTITKPKPTSSTPSTGTSSSIFSSKLSPALRSMLSAANIAIDSLSRTPITRLEKTALPNIGVIELVSAPDFMRHYDALYTAMFPRRAERERSDLIVDRLAAQASGERIGLAPYRIVGIRDSVTGEAIGAAQFSVLPLSNDLGEQQHGQQQEDNQSNDVPENGSPSSNFAVPYLQYLYIRPQNRRQDMSEVLHTMVLAVSSADALAMGDGRTVPFTLFETEPPDHGDDVASRAYARVRSSIHTSTGGLALMLRREIAAEPQPEDNSGNTDEANMPTKASSAQLLSPHVQPGLEDGDPPLTLVWVIRQSPNPGRPYDVDRIGRRLIAAYYQSLRDEGFPEKNIKLAEMIVEEICRGSVFHLMPLGEVPDLKDQVYDAMGKGG
ncbi:hypothetical protein A1O1_05320 [Capronia coronata CBS 617.96]|uniref:Uncharacterized protein n=1 Tax=Capronia coronata CBS 617.96 TaxID=1182541 RepID=W9YFG8_9EURO|nr:uncharacterized protein A1O1_05320 [Capronia coronata CBS 617.96]EXJ88390.1 hypothetical protein A1O1_05320 [Capronia coronata CBS 617.96]